MGCFAPGSLAASQVLEACGADERNHNLRAVLPKGCAALARVLAPGDLARLSVRRRRTRADTHALQCTHAKRTHAACLHLRRTHLHARQQARNARMPTA